jgi:predicted dehydrogenase
VLGDIGCHLLDLATALTGQVNRARCLLATFPKIGKDGKAITSYGGKKLDANDTAVIELLLENGATVVLHMTRWAVGHQNQIRLEVHGTSGALEFDLDRSYDQLNLCAGKDVANAQWKTLELKATPNNWERFIRAIKTKKADQPDILRGAQVQAYLDGCERSAKSGCWEDIKPWE